MPESQFGSTPGSLEETLNELVALARHLRATPENIRARLARLEGLCQMLAYFSAPSDEVPPDTWPISLNTHCAHTSCSRTWRDHDACLLNFARTDEPPIWLCRDHHPPLSDGGIRPPGYQPNNDARASLDTLRRATLDKLTPAERSTINTRIADMSSGSGE